MQEPSGGQYQPSSMLVHNLINRLSVIIGRCDLILERLQAEGESPERLLKIRGFARSMADELIQDGIARYRHEIGQAKQSSI